MAVKYTKMVTGFPFQGPPKLTKIEHFLYANITWQTITRPRVSFVGELYTAKIYSYNSLSKNSKYNRFAVGLTWLKIYFYPEENTFTQKRIILPRREYFYPEENTYTQKKILLFRKENFYPEENTLPRKKP
jgi:hypothetical protein